MVRFQVCGLSIIDGSPHVRGDGPRFLESDQRLFQFSPRAWGWSGGPRSTGEGIVVLPTCVGMVRCPLRTRRRYVGSPHVRGDGPPGERCDCPENGFSPRAWGWSALHELHESERGVLPTCVGMVLNDKQKQALRESSPHVRGDGPAGTFGTPNAFRFSPRAWGWSGLSGEEPHQDDVLPTCVGMVRRRGLARLSSQRGNSDCTISQRLR